MHPEQAEATIDLADLSARARAGLIRFGICSLAPMAIDTEVRVVTERSVWLIRPDRYLRLPLTETTRQRNDHAIDDRLDDAQWHGLRAGWWCWDMDGCLRVRLLPVAGPEDGAGIVTGLVTGTGSAVGGARDRDVGDGG